MSIGTQIKIAQGKIWFPQKPVSIEGCTSKPALEYLSKTLDVSEPFPLYRMSYMYYTAVGTITAIIIGMIVSLLTGGNKERRNIDLFSPIIHRFIRKPSEDIKLDKL